MNWRLSHLCALLCLSAVAAREVDAQMQHFVSLRRANQQLKGRIVEFTRQHGSDNRFHSRILGQRRDLYVYLPPGYNPRREYPLLVYLHGAFGDEHAFLKTGQLEYLDKLICGGDCPPMIVVCPDGTCSGRNLVFGSHSFWINGRAGRFEDHLMQEVLPWAISTYSVAPSRRLHAVSGISAGGFGAMKLALKHHEFFGHVISISGALNLRYQTRGGDYFANFDPVTYRPRTEWDPEAVIGKMGLISLKAKSFMEPIFGSRSEDIVAGVLRENPIDLLERTDLQPGELSLFVAFGAKDGLNFDAQGACFARAARLRGLTVDVVADPEGDHAGEYFSRAQHVAYRWLGRRLLEAADAAAPAPRPVVIAEPQLTRSRTAARYHPTAGPLQSR